MRATRGGGGEGRHAGLVLEKYQTLGNCYLLLDPGRNGLPLDHVPDADLVGRLCDPRFGLGSDGLLVGPEPRADGAFAFRIVNSDGSRAQFSGNGTRIFARYLFDAGHAPSARAVLSLAALAATGEEVRSRAWRGDGPPATVVTDLDLPLRRGAAAVAADPGVLEPAEGEAVTVAPIAALGRELFGTAAWTRSTLLSIGNPHCVTRVAAPDLLPTQARLEALRDRLGRIADRPAGDARSPFAEGCNLQWIWAEAPDRLHLRIVERGEGPTLASGSSATAAACAALLAGEVGPALTVVMAGGELPVRLGRPQPGRIAARLVAPVERIATCRLF